ncbi:hypothetical protein K488DRAFT_82353 [Vararia minispora EC-137]|uniref:Uncharacterized protein n=1 Tax=Vararia minispora EC-137 TaxID=1314806 RepID=A0ACB8QWN8_9AGAM|nr:hypothetical protein K488DRAFT_82353 [Vararia minispora EC-137]
MPQSRVVYEITSFQVSRAYLENPYIFKSATAYIAENAPHGNYTGLQVEEPVNKLTSFTGWDSIEQHVAFRTSTAHTELVSRAQAAKAGDATTFHTSFENDEQPALNSKITELVWVAPKQGVDLTDLARAVALAVRNFNGDAEYPVGEEKCSGAAWGYVVEKKVICYVAGWPSMEARNAICRRMTRQTHGAVKEAKIWLANGDREAENWDDIAVQTIVHLKLEPSSA